jgi:broad specificity phosphatase PhoE
MKLYFVRHGHMSATPETSIDPKTGQIDEPLSETGVQQATELANELKDVHFDEIISSALKRASQTAEIISEYHELIPVIDNVWRERDTGGYVTAEVWNELFNFDKNFLTENTEDLHTFFRRIYTALDTLKEKYSDKTVLIVSHGGVHQAVYAYANNLQLVGNVRNSPLHNCEYKIYDL